MKNQWNSAVLPLETFFYSSESESPFPSLLSLTITTFNCVGGEVTINLVSRKKIGLIKSKKKK